MASLFLPILVLGVVVAREMGYGSIPVARCDVSVLPGSGEARLRDGVLDLG